MAGTPETLYVQQDFQFIPPINLVVPVISGDATASAANVGLVYRNSVSGRLRYVRDASTIVSIDIAGLIANADIAAGAAIALSKLATDPLARANHTGTQIASTISDFDAQVRTNRLDQLANPTTAVNFGGQRATNGAQASGGTDFTTLQQVQNLLSAGINGNDYKNSARVAVGTNVSLTAPGASLDGVALAAGNRVLLYGQTAPAENGLYDWTAAGTALVRSTDADANSEVSAGMTVPIEEGTRADNFAILTTDGAITLGTTGLAFTFISGPGAYVAGTGITITGTTISLPTVTIGLGGTGATTAAGARSNLVANARGVQLPVASALVAGVGLAVAHGLGTSRVVVEVQRVADGALIKSIGVQADATNVTLTADIAVAGGTFQLNVIPAA